MILHTQYQSSNNTIEKYCYDDNQNNCSLYGGLYAQSEAMSYSTTPKARGICPAGFHIPDDSEVNSLSAFANGNSNVLKAIGQGTGTGAGYKHEWFFCITWRSCQPTDTFFIGLIMVLSFGLHLIMVQIPRCL